MATTTPNFGWDVPQSTDLVKDGATAIAALGNDIDTSLVDLKGGTTGQVLSKASNTDMDFSWYSLPSSLNPALVQIDSTEYLRPNVKTYATLDTGQITEDRTYFIPIFIPACTADRIAVQTSSQAISGTSTVRLGVYNVSTTTGKPTTVLFDAGTVVCNAINTTFTITINQTFTAGWYYLAFNLQTKGAGANWISGDELTMQSLVRNSLTNGTYYYYYEASITGAFATAGTVVKGTAAPVPMVYLRMV